MKTSLRIIGVSVLLIGCIAPIVLWRISVMRADAPTISNANSTIGAIAAATNTTDMPVPQEVDDGNQQVESTANVPDVLTYESKNYDFVLTFPISWKGYTVTELEGNEPGVVADAVLVFNTPDVNEIFTIDIWKKTTEEPPQAVIESEKMMLGESNDYYFEYEGISAAILEDNGLTPAEVSQIQTEIQQVAESFGKKQ